MWAGYRGGDAATSLKWDGIEPVGSDLGSDGWHRYDFCASAT